MLFKVMVFVGKAPTYITHICRIGMMRDLTDMGCTCALGWPEIWVIAK